MTLSIFQHIRPQDFASSLPGDDCDVNQPRQVTGAAWSPVTPQLFPNASLLATTEDLATELGFDNKELESADFLKLVSGQDIPEPFTSYAQCYGGHQFGNWAGQLGDGRAINILEINDTHGKPQILQLKGAGPTPYSRTADGYAVLRSSVREFLCSEAMHHLGVPTTRALSLVSTGESVVRDMFYEGRPEREPGAIVCRVAPTFLRLGSYEIFAARQEIAMLEKLVSYTLQTHFTNISSTGKEAVCELFDTVCQKTAHLMVEWARVGFVHGVMNTDNLSVLGLTIDYGPYGWLENYDPDWTPNTTDAQGRRYRFGQQANISLWNLVQFANALYPLVEDVKPFEESLERYKSRYDADYKQMQKNKLGLVSDHDDDAKLIHALLNLLPQTEVDMTLFYRCLAEIGTSQNPEEAFGAVTPAFYQPPAESVSSSYIQWFTNYLERLSTDTVTDAERKTQMNRVNPLYVLRNYLAQQAIDKATEGDLSGISELQCVLKNPYEEQSDKQHLAQKRPEWARHKAGCSMLSCSS